MFENYDYLIIIIIFTIFLSFFSVIMYYVQKYPVVNTLTGLCAPGQCPTNIYTGEKRCPQNNEIFSYNPKYEVCNSKFTCENKLTPYALLSDGSTDEMGICETDTICRCLNKSQCATNNLVIFKFTNDGIITQEDSIPQGDYSKNLNKTTMNEYCNIKAYNLNRISPGSCYFSDISNISLQELQECLRFNPCLSGTIAFNPKNPDLFKVSESDKHMIYSIPVGCFPSLSNPDSIIPMENYCDFGFLPVWDKYTLEIKCLKIES